MAELWETVMGKPKKKKNQKKPLPVPEKSLSGANGALRAAGLC